MFYKLFSHHLILILIAVPKIVVAGPVSSPDISTKGGKSNNNLNSTQQPQQLQFQKLNNNQDAQLNSLNVYASNLDVLSSSQNEEFRPSYKLPEMETNFKPIHNGNSIAPEFTSILGSPTPVLMQYLPQTINEGGVQYLQLIPTRPLMVPIAPYLPGSPGGQQTTYQQLLNPSNNIDYTGRPLFSTLPANMPPAAPTSLLDIQSPTLPTYGMQSYAGNITPYKQNHRINRETKDKPSLGPISLNLNEYIPQPNSQQHSNVNIRGRP